MNVSLSFPYIMHLSLFIRVIYIKFSYEVSGAFLLTLRIHIDIQKFLFDMSFFMSEVDNIYIL